MVHTARIYPNIVWCFFIFRISNIDYTLDLKTSKDRVLYFVQENPTGALFVILIIIITIGYAYISVSAG